MITLISLTNQLTRQDVIVSGTGADQGEITCDHDAITCIGYGLPVSSASKIHEHHIKIKAGENIWYLAAEPNGEVLKKKMDRPPVSWMNWQRGSDQSLKVFQWPDGTVDIRVDV